VHLYSNMAERITIKDISKHLKIHHSTVSHTLRNSPQVKKVKQKIELLNMIQGKDIQENKQIVLKAKLI